MACLLHADIDVHESIDSDLESKLDDRIRTCTVRRDAGQPTGYGLGHVGGNTYTITRLIADTCTVAYRHRLAHVSEVHTIDIVMHDHHVYM